MKKRLVNCFTFFAFLVFTACADDVKYIFLLIGDGYGANQRVVTETLTGKKLTMSQLPTTVRTGTNNKEGKTTDSAASGTAIACGIKTYNGMLGVDHNGAPVESLAMKLQKRGFKIAMISSSPLNDATPGAHYAHQPNRGMFAEIVEDMAKSGFAFFGGAGFKGKEKESYIASLKTHGYDYLAGPEALAKAQPGKKVFVDCDPFATWNPGDTSDSPSLAQYLTKSIELLDNPTGFFIMLENGQTDYAGHNNDAGKMYREVLVLDEAVKVALAFQAKRPTETLVIVTADHETGGLQLQNPTHEQLQILTLQKGAKSDLNDALAEELKTNKTASSKYLTQTFEDYLGIKFTDTEASDIAKLFPKKPSQVKTAIAEAFKMRDLRAGLQYTTGGHSKAKIITNIQGPGADKFTFPLENSDLPHIIASIVMPDYKDEDYWKERHARIEQYKLIEPFLSLDTAPTGLVETIMLPLDTKKIALAGKTYTVNLPDWRRFAESSTRVKDGAYLIETANHHKTMTLKYKIAFNADEKGVFHVYDPLTRRAYVNTNGNTWTAAALKTDFLAQCAPESTAYLLCSPSPIAEMTGENILMPQSNAGALESSSETKPIFYTLKITSTDNPPKIDGQLNDEAWKNAPANEWTDSRGEALSNPVILKALTDKNHATLFLAFSVPDTNIIARATEKDTTQYEDDAVEIFLSAYETNTYYQIVISANGTVFDSKNGNPAWNTDMQAAVVAANKDPAGQEPSSAEGWLVEVAIPLAQFGFDAPIAGNFCRNSRPENQLSNLSPTYGNFHDKEAFVLFEFTE